MNISMENSHVDIGAWRVKIYQWTNGYRGQRKELRGKENNTMVKFAIRSFQLQVLWWSSFDDNTDSNCYHKDCAPHKHLVWNLIHQEVVNGLVDFLAKNYEQIIFLIRTFHTFETIDEKIGTSPKCKLLFLDSLLPLHPAPTWPRFESRRQYLQEKHYYSPILIWSKMWDKKPLC